MDGTKKRLEQELRIAVGRLRRLEGVDVIEESYGALGGPAALADEMDVIQASERRELGFATRELLVDRVNRLVAALDRLESGEYGTCVECGETIAPARLRVMPEVATCVRCQDRLERLGRQLTTVGVETDDD